MNAMTVAGRAVPDPLGAVTTYLSDHHGTVARYDLLPRPRSVGVDLIRATRSPWMNSRISEVHAAWFIERAPSAPWDLVPGDADLVDADPVVAGGLYDDAETLFRHFLDDAPSGVSLGKISKVLHLMRPRLYPILDSALLRQYRSAATDAAHRLALHRPDLGRHRRLYWAAIREDLVENAAALGELRRALRSSDVPRAADVADSVGDVRFLDILAWAA